VHDGWSRGFLLFGGALVGDERQDGGEDFTDTVGGESAYGADSGHDEVVRNVLGSNR
jgi:hypothetical protein